MTETLTPHRVDAPTREFLVWVARTPRAYREAMDAWGSHCPRFTVWEDTLAAGLIEIHSCAGTPVDDAAVTLTPTGCALLADRNSA